MAFQICAGTEWPTAEIYFSPDGKPWFRIELAWLRSGLADHEGSVWALEQCVLHDAPEYFLLAKDKGSASSLFSQFGYHWWALMPRRKLDSEVAMAASALSKTLPLFLQRDGLVGSGAIGIKGGYVTNNLIKCGSPGCT